MNRLSVVYKFLVYFPAINSDLWNNLNFAEREGNIYGIANASNAIAFDYSANHLYAESFNYGKKSLDTALEGIRCIDVEMLEMIN